MSLTVGHTSNLVVNGDAEHGPDKGGRPVRSVTGWTVAEGEPALVPYGTTGGYPRTGDPGPPRRGSRLFTGGVSPRTALRQDVQLPRTGACGRKAVDAGKVRFTAEAWLGGHAESQDGARLSVEFRDAKGTPVALAVLGPVTAADRKERTGLVRRRAEAAVPPGARTVRLLLVLTRTGDGTSDDTSSNDGYADGVSLTLTTAAEGAA